MNSFDFDGGLYIHFPFCKQACNYCNFHFSTSFAYKNDLIRSLHREIALQAGLFGSKKLKTVYFGGGTPSLLSAEEINYLFTTIEQQFDIRDLKEITLEANPDDLTEDYLSALSQTPVNRLSIGIQSFHEEDLRWMNRAHNVQQAMECIPNAYHHGFDNLSIDLIFGYPLLSDEKLNYNLQLLEEWKVKHISAYSLTIEDKTPLQKKINLGLDFLPDADQAANQFCLISNHLTRLGYEHYEISNYSLTGYNAIHNSNYWHGIPYLGIGPSAHSYYNNKRYWNINNNNQYIQSITKGILPNYEEIIDDKTAYNELILTRLRTKWGVTLEDISSISMNYADHFLIAIKPFIASNHIIIDNSNYLLSLDGRLIADHITTELFL